MNETLRYVNTKIFSIRSHLKKIKQTRRSNTRIIYELSIDFSVLFIRVSLFESIKYSEKEHVRLTVSRKIGERKKTKWYRSFAFANALFIEDSLGLALEIWIFSGSFHRETRNRQYLPTEDNSSGESPKTPRNLLLSSSLKHVTHTFILVHTHTDTISKRSPKEQR